MFPLIAAAHGLRVKFNQSQGQDAELLEEGGKVTTITIIK